MGKHKLTIEEMKQQMADWFNKQKDYEEETKLSSAWKRLRPSRDAMEYKLPGNYRG
jgi:hypothetical protein